MGRDCLLGDVLTLQRGYDLPSHARREGPIPIVSSSGVTGTHAEAKVAGPGVVTGRYGTLGEIHYVPGAFWPLNTTLYVRDFKGNDPRFVAYFLQTLNFANRSAAAAVPGINRNDLHRIPVHWPDLQQQLRIAAILSAYDDLIENNTRRIAILEEMARRIYEEWFVRFRFPGHEGVRMVGSDLGLVPEGWGHASLSDLCISIEDGDWIETKDQGGDEFRLLQISNVGVNRFVETGNFRFISKETFKRLRCREIMPGQLLIARMPTPIGRAWLVTPKPWRMVTAVDVAIVEADVSKTSPEFLLHFLNSDATLAAFATQASGTTRLRITRRQIEALPLLAPPAALAHSFSEIVRPMNELVAVQTRRNETLRATRGLLLPKLISGDLDVSAMPKPEELAA